MENHWKKCSSCKNPIGFNTKYYTCSVSTCNGQRTGYVFCSMDCFERHLPGARHRDAGAVSHQSPSSQTAAMATEAAPERRRIISSSSAPAKPQGTKIPHEVLIVASKLKDYIRAVSDMNTSGSVMETLSDFVRQKCDEAINKARQDGRKTVMDRDFD